MVYNVSNLSYEFEQLELDDDSAKQTENKYRGRIFTGDDYVLVDVIVDSEYDGEVPSGWKQIFADFCQIANSIAEETEISKKEEKIKEVLSNYHMSDLCEEDLGTLRWLNIFNALLETSIQDKPEKWNMEYIILKQSVLNAKYVLTRSEYGKQARRLENECRQIQLNHTGRDNLISVYTKTDEWWENGVQIDINWSAIGSVSLDNAEKYSKAMQSIVELCQVQKKYWDDCVLDFS